jgi:hypothetical protein
VHAQRSNATPPSQESDTAGIGRAASGYVISSFSLRPVRQDDGNELPFVNSSGEQSLVTSERKHIHFNDKVEQWIAVDIIHGDDEDGIESYAIGDDDDADDSTSDDGFLMMKGSLDRSSESKQSKHPSD